MLTSLPIVETLDFPDCSYNESVHDVHVRSRSSQNNNMLHRRFVIIIIIFKKRVVSDSCAHYVYRSETSAFRRRRYLNNNDNNQNIYRTDAYVINTAPGQIVSRALSRKNVCDGNVSRTGGARKPSRSEPFESGEKKKKISAGRRAENAFIVTRVPTTTEQSFRRGRERREHEIIDSFSRTFHGADVVSAKRKKPNVHRRTMTDIRFGK